MKLDITTIPVQEVFDPREGCPLCRLRDQLEQRVVTYITGAAMMEPDVRQDTNRLGFCLRHYEAMLGQRNRLGVALMLDSHLQELDKRVFGGGLLGGSSPARQAQAAAQSGSSCFVCSQVNANFPRLLEAVCRLWDTEAAFRVLFDEQPALCLPHFAALAEAAPRALNKKRAAALDEAASALCRRTLHSLQGDVAQFCQLFDYRNAGTAADAASVGDAIERTVGYLTGREPR